MKPKNFPGRKLNAGRDMGKPYTDTELKALAVARDVRTKKMRVST